MTKLEVRDVSLFNLNCVGDGGVGLASFQEQNHANVELQNPCTLNSEALLSA
jgi:hypothetical protein